MHPNAARQAVQLHRASGHLRHAGLQFDGFKLRIRLLVAQKQRQDPRARAQIGNAFPRPCAGKIRQQDGVHAKAEAVLFLQNMQPVQLQVVDSFSRSQFHVPSCGSRH